MIAAAFFLFGVVSGIAFLAVCIAWDRPAPTPAPDLRDFDANLSAKWRD